MVLAPNWVHLVVRSTFNGWDWWSSRLVSPQKQYCSTLHHSLQIFSLWMLLLDANANKNIAWYFLFFCHIKYNWNRNVQLCILSCNTTTSLIDDTIEMPINFKRKSYLWDKMNPNEQNESYGCYKTGRQNGVSSVSIPT